MSDESGGDRSDGDLSAGDRSADGEHSASETDAWGRVDDGPAEPATDADETPTVPDETAPEDRVDDAALDDLEDEEHEPSVAGVFGARPEDAPPRPEIVPESPDLENALFVLLGVLFGVFVIYRAAVVFAG